MVLFYSGLFAICFNIVDYFISEFSSKKDREKKDKTEINIMDKYYSPFDENLD